MPAQTRLYSANQETDCEKPALSLEMFRSFVCRLKVSQSGSANGRAGADSEEVLLDVKLDGWRYLLIRTAVPTKARMLLSPREQEIVRMVAEGHPNKVIAEVLNISSWTVGTHLRRIFGKLGVSSRAAMVARCPEIANRTTSYRPLSRYEQNAHLSLNTAREAESDDTEQSKTA